MNTHRRRRIRVLGVAFAASAMAVAVAGQSVKPVHFHPHTSYDISLVPPSPLPLDKINQYISVEMQRQQLPGLQLGIYRRGEILITRGYGLANVELNVPVTPETLFQSASVGKQFVSAAIMMLVEEGKVNLDDSITKYFARAPKSWEPIKVSNLLSHTSGIADFEKPFRLFKPTAPFYLRLDFTEDELFDKFTALPLDFPVGEKWAYSNTNYELLGILIRKVTGKFYADFLGERIFRPLGMTATRVNNNQDIIPNRSSGYQMSARKGGVLQNQQWASSTFNSTADGSLYFNVLDLAKWDAALYTETLVKKSSLDQMWTIFPLNDGKPNNGNYGFGWFINSINSHRVIEHNGGWLGFTMTIARYVDDDLTVVVMTNIAGADTGTLTHFIAGLCNAALIPSQVSLPRKEN